MLSKKIIIAVLAGVTVLGLCACNSHENEQVTVGIANPIKEVTEEEMVEYTGIDFPAKKGMENIIYSTIDGKAAQTTFTMNGIEYTLRAQSTSTTDTEQVFDECEKLAGMYYEWNEKIDTQVVNRPARILITEDNKGEIVWFDVVPGIEYSLSTDGDASELETVASTVFTPMQE